MGGLRLLALLVTAPWIGQSCSCDRITPIQAFGDAAIVFRGRVTKVTMGPHTSPGRIIFEVSRVWKGSVPQRFEMMSIVAGSDCLGFSAGMMKSGSDLLVYGVERKFGLPPQVGFVTSVCSRSNFIRKAAEDLSSLGAGRAPTGGTRP